MPMPSESPLRCESWFILVVYSGGRAQDLSSMIRQTWPGLLCRFSAPQGIPKNEGKTKSFFRSHSFCLCSFPMRTPATSRSLPCPRCCRSLRLVDDPQDDLERHAIAPDERSPLAIRVRRSGKPHRRQPGAGGGPMSLANGNIEGGVMLHALLLLLLLLLGVSFVHTKQQPWTHASPLAFPRSYCSSVGRAVTPLRRCEDFTTCDRSPMPTT